MHSVGVAPEDFNVIVVGRNNRFVGIVRVGFKFVIAVFRKINGA